MPCGAPGVTVASRGDTAPSPALGGKQVAMTVQYPSVPRPVPGTGLRRPSARGIELDDWGFPII